MVEAFAWGAVAASSLLIGALVGLVRPWPPRAIGLVLGFGAGALISAVSFELAQEGVEIGGGPAVGVGLAVGALTYYACDTAIERRAGNAEDGSALALGAFLDGIPEQLVLGLGIALGDGVSVGLLGAIFVSNLPEAIGSAAAMRGAGRTRRQVTTLWAAVAAICTVATGVGFAIADTVSDTLQGAINGFAAGALVVMLVDSMIPEAHRQAGRATGLVTTLGFAVAAGMSGIG
ncbi:MAG: zinc transporter, family [Solirubrobacterales bacterium]|jgi:ZIP family zinc transporter|nr:zinc transporter, family [Solirubrobacterales bacterium]MEA2330306.1 zinc transporter, family [Thermoleophilaceae bacterium]